MFASSIRRSGPVRLRAVLALLLALALGPWLHGPAPPARAADIDFNNPTRVQIILRSVHIYGDTDWLGGGEFTLTADFFRCSNEIAPCVPGQAAKLLSRNTTSLGGSTGDTVKLDRVLPTTGDETFNSYTIDAATGFTMYKGESYRLSVEIIDHDPGGDDWLGDVHVPMHVGNNWHLGVHTDDAIEEGGTGRGQFALEYEIVRTPLADLVPFSAPEYYPVEARLERVCAKVGNIGLDRSPPSVVTFHFTAGSIPQHVEVPVVSLQPQHNENVCTTVQLHMSGAKLTWGLSVDAHDQVPELYEHNNGLTVPFTRRATESAAPLTVPSPPPSPPAVQADLSVSALKLNGQVPDGKDDCKDGKIVVAVVVRNTGTANAESVVVRLLVDGAEKDASEQTVKELGAGKEQEVRFEGVHLKKGEHKLTVQADAKGQVAEADEDNNALTVTARC